MSAGREYGNLHGFCYPKGLFDKLGAKVFKKRVCVLSLLLFYAAMASEMITTMIRAARELNALIFIFF